MHIIFANILSVLQHIYQLVSRHCTTNSLYKRNFKNDEIYDIYKLIPTNIDSFPQCKKTYYVYGQITRVARAYRIANNNLCTYRNTYYNNLCTYRAAQGSLSRGGPCLFSTRSIFSTHEKKQVSIRPGVNVPGAYLCRSIDRSAFVYILSRMISLMINQCNDNLCIHRHACAFRSFFIYLSNKLQERTEIDVYGRSTYIYLSHTSSLVNYIRPGQLLVVVVMTTPNLVDFDFQDFDLGSNCCRFRCPQFNGVKISRPNCIILNELFRFFYILLKPTIFNFDLGSRCRF